MSLNISKTGILLESQLNEYHVEPDGSIWEHVFHHEHLETNSFLASEKSNFPKGIYKSPQMWFNFNVCNQLSGDWEILWIQNALITDPSKKFRWVQHANPLTATFDDVAAANITRNTSAGYTDFSYGGLYKFDNDSKTYLCANNGTNGNWWGACGKYGVYQGGTLAWAGEIVKTGQIDIFVRVDSIVRNAKIYKAGNITVENNFYEY